MASQDPTGAAGAPSGPPPPPPEGFEFKNTPGWAGDVQWNLNVVLIAFSSLFIFLRLGTRAFLVKALGLDDAIGFIAYGVLVSFSALEIRSVGFGSGTHMEYVPPYFIPKFFSAFTTQHLMYFWAVGMTRLAIVAFLLRMSADVLYRRLVYGVAVFISCQTISCFLFRLLECKNIKDLWLPPGSGDCVSKDSEAIMMWTHAAAGIAADVALFALPIWVVQSKMIFSAKMVRVILIFCVGLFAAITGIVRLSIMVRTNFAENTTFKMSTIAFWTDLEGHVGLWVACFPALQPLVRITAYHLGLRSSLHSSGRTGPSGQNSSRTPHSLRKSGYIRGGHDADDYDADSSKSNGAIVQPRALEMEGMGGKPEYGIRRDVEFAVYSSRVGDAEDEQALRGESRRRPWE